MTKNVFGMLMFVAGAAVGVAATYKFFKNKYDKKSKEDIEEIREYYASKKAKEDEDLKKNLDDIKDLESEEKIEAYKKMVKDTCCYATSDEDIEVEVKLVKNNNEEKPVKQSNEKNTILIKPTEFGEIQDDTGEKYDMVTLVYYEDGIVTYWEDAHTVDDVEGLLGTEFKDHFGDYGEEDTVYVRNIRNETDYEVIRDGDSYYVSYPEERGGEDE